MSTQDPLPPTTPEPADARPHGRASADHARGGAEGAARLQESVSAVAHRLGEKLEAARERLADEAARHRTGS